MRFLFIFALVVASLLFVPGAAAQVNGTQNTTGTYVDDGLEILDAGYDDETGEAYVVLRSERPESVTISDGGSLNEGSGPIPTTAATVDGRTRIEVGATEVGGRVAVTIDHDDGLYGHLIRNQSEKEHLVGGPWSARDSQIVGFTAAVTVAIVILIQMARWKLGRNHNPERIA